VIERAFDPFFTTKGVGKGTGLGLSQVYGVARQAGGTALITNAPGGGAVVTLLLRRSSEPAAPTPPRAAPDGPQPVLAPETGGTVLVVDDEDAVRALACEILELLGYVVLQAESGAKALELLAAERPDIMLLDYAMPVMNGAELAKLARRLWPDVPIVFASGHADTAQVEAALGGEAVILRKPFNMETLARTIAALLNPPAP
jgi:CheY-like chemotaxis protein